MLLVLASRWDEQASEFGRSCDDVRLLTPDDLSTDGWAFQPSAPDSDYVVADGKRIPKKEITGVFTRLPCVMAHELLQIAPQERDYVAAEMHAFLVAWLSTLTCPVVNRHTPGFLSGPAWGREKWISEAAKQSIPVAEFDRDSTSDAHHFVPTTVVTVLGDKVFGTTDQRLRAHAKRLGRIADVIAATVYFAGELLQSASSAIDLGNGELRRALLSHFGMRCSGHDDSAVGIAR